MIFHVTGSLFWKPCWCFFIQNIETTVVCSWNWATFDFCGWLYVFVGKIEQLTGWTLKESTQSYFFLSPPSVLDHHLKIYLFIYYTDLVSLKKNILLKIPPPSLKILKYFLQNSAFWPKLFDRVKYEHNISYPNLTIVFFLQYL